MDEKKEILEKINIDLKNLVIRLHAKFENISFEEAEKQIDEFYKFYILGFNYGFSEGKKYAIENALNLIKKYTPNNDNKNGDNK